MERSPYHISLTINLQYLAVAVLLCLLTSCSKVIDFGDLSSSNISGKVINSNLVLGLNCTSSSVKLYKTDAMGMKTGSALATSPVKSDGSYSFRLSGNAKNNLTSTTISPLMIELSGCSNSYRRFISGKTNQNLSASSYLISFVAGAVNVTSSQGQGLDQLLTALESEDTENDVYSSLSGSVPLTTTFQNTFGVHPNVLIDLPPTITSSSVGASGAEGSPMSLAATVSHWYGTYDMAHEWHEVWTEHGVVQERLLGTSASGTWTPSNNSQGPRSIKILVGQNNGSGRVNLTEPYSSETFSVSISNTTPVSVPSVAFSGTTVSGVGYTSSASINLTFNTGTLQSNGMYQFCQNFSDLAIIERNDSAPTSAMNAAPSSEAQWSIQCNTLTTQTIAMNLTTGVGSKTLRVWARDSSGNVSSTPFEIPVVYSTSTPTVAFSTPLAGAVVNGSAITVSGTCQTYAGNVTLSGPIDDGLGNNTMTLACTAGVWSGALTLTGVDGAKVLTASQTDPLSQTGSSTQSYTKDTSPPILTNSNTTGMINTAGVTLTGNCETGINVQISGTGITSSINATCSSGTYSQAVSFSSGQGAKAITLSQTDSAGNNSSLNISYTLDTVAPVISITAPAVNADVQGSITIQGSCESGVTVNISGDISAPTTASCSGTFSQTITFSAGEGAKSVTVSQTDAATNSASMSRSFTKDTIAPVVATLFPLTTTPHQSSVTITGTCESGINVVGSGDITGSPSVLCTAGTFSLTVGLSGSDGAKAVTLTQTDLSLNAGSTTLNLVKDNGVPGLTQVSVASGSATSSAVSFGGACESGINVIISGAETASATCSGTWTYTATVSADALYTYTFTQTDGAGNIASVNTSWRIDTLPPYAQAGTFKLNGSATPATATNVNMTAEFEAHDSGSGVNSFCLFYNTTAAPASNDPCWVDVATVGLTRGTTVNLTLAQNYFFQTGYGIGDYDVYLWVRDLAGHVSVLTNSGSGTVGTDHILATYDPGIPPTISSFVALSTDLPSNPPLASQVQALQGAHVVLRWRVTDDTPILPGRIKISFFNPATQLWENVLGAQSLNNGANGSCTVDDPLTPLVETGCYMWSGGSPSSSPYQVRMVVLDSSNQTEQISSAPMNTGNMRVIAGNTDPGLGGSARTAMFFPKGSEENAITHQFVISPNGNAFIYDDRGLLRIKPSEGVVRLLIPNTGTNSSFGLPASQTTVRDIRGVGLDHSGNVLLRINARILRFSSTDEDPVVTSIIGGGGSTADGTLAHQYSLTDWGTNLVLNHNQLVTLPNGRIYFFDNKKFRYFDPTSGTIESIPVGGAGIFGNPTSDIANCGLANLGFEFNSSSQFTTMFATIEDYAICSTSTHTSLVEFDPITFQSKGDVPYPANHPNPDWSHQMTWKTGLDGSLHGVSYNTGKFLKYNKATHSLVSYFGGVDQGNCEDGELASSCSVTPQDIFVDKFGKIYFYDGGRIRVIQNNGRLLTLFGAGKMAGDLGTALSARMENVRSLSRANDGTYFFLQTTSHVIRKFISGGNIERYAGTGNSGTFTLGDAASTHPIMGLKVWSSHNSFALDPVTKDIYFADRYYVFKLNGSTGIWDVNLIGATSGSWVPTTDGELGANVYMYWNHPRVTGLHDNKVIVSFQQDVFPNGHTRQIKAFDALDSYRQSHIAGSTINSLPTPTFCATGNATNSCFADIYTIDNGAISYDAVDEKFIIPAVNSVYISKSNNTYEVLSGYPKLISVAYRRVTGSPDQEYVYWCDDYGIIRKRNIASSSETDSYIPVLGMKCAGRDMSWNDTTKKIIFPFTQNGLWGVAEIYDP